MSQIQDNAIEKVPPGTARSPQWPHARLVHLKANPRCAVCGGMKKLEVHHKLPFHLHPQLELDQANLITLCENGGDGVNCHLLFGHLGNFKSFNSTIDADAGDWAHKLSTRPAP